MSKTEYAWVIQRDDGKFINFDITNSLIYPDGTVIDSGYSVQENVYSASMAWSKHRAEYLIESYELNNCRPVKVKIEIVGEDDE